MESLLAESEAKRAAFLNDPCVAQGSGRERAGRPHRRNHPQRDAHPDSVLGAEIAVTPMRAAIAVAAALTSMTPASAETLTCSTWQGIRTCQDGHGYVSRETEWQGFTFGDDSDGNKMDDEPVAGDGHHNGRATGWRKIGDCKCSDLRIKSSKEVLIADAAGQALKAALRAPRTAFDAFRVGVPHPMPSWPF